MEVFFNAWTDVVVDVKVDVCQRCNDVNVDLASKVSGDTEGRKRREASAEARFTD